jgi:hypothetical protein
MLGETSFLIFPAQKMAFTPTLTPLLRLPPREFEKRKAARQADIVHQTDFRQFLFRRPSA